VTEGTVLGLDIGGSSSRARLVDGGRIVAEAHAPGANVASIDPSVVQERLTHLIQQLGSPHPAACCAGAAGSEVPAGRRLLEDLLARLLPGA
jgi:N-acetylglucosamine kinase-like BadF-type ATPase